MRTNNALMHGASASAPRCHDVVSVAAASVATDAGNAAGLADAHAVSAATLAAAAGSVASPARSINSSISSDSDNSDMIGGGCAAFAADGDDVDKDMPTDVEASKYSFLDRLEHYMERALISDLNRKAVELAIMIELGTNVREIDSMKKYSKEKAFLNSYVTIIWEIPDERFENEAVCAAMLIACTGARKRILEGGTLWRKYKSE